MSHGRHHKPSSTLRNLAVVSASGAFAAVGPLAGAAHADEPEPGPPTTVDWSPIIACESGGNPRAQNPSSTASGLYQILDTTWRAYGGASFAPRAKDATPAQQTLVAERLYAAGGFTPWAASRGCWAGKAHTSHQPRSAPAPRPGGGAAAGGGYVVRAGDTLSGIAATHGVTWEQLWEANRATIADPNRICAGWRLALPVASTPAKTPAPAVRGGSAGAGTTPQPGGSGQMLTIELTGYSWQDNTPPGSAVVSHPVVHKRAGGTGTYDDPITVAVPNTGKGQFAAGTKFYLPSIKRYVIVEDTGASPAGGGVDAHLDMWIDGHDGTRSATDACMDRLTGTVRAELNPPPGRPVIAGPVFSSGACRI